MGPNRFRQGWLTALIVAWVGLAAAASAAAPAINATIEPAEIALGESAQLTIAASGSTMPPLTLPVVSGLDIRYAGQSRQIQMINGVTISTTSIMFRVTPQAPGIFTIPGITPKSQPLVLRVNSRNGTGNSALPNSGGSAGQAPPASRSNENGIHLTPDGSAFVRLEVAKREIYVGESVPVGIEVGMRDGFVASLNGLPTLNGSDFTLNNLSQQPERVQRLIDGKPFTVLTWHSVLAAVKPGTFSLTMETPLTVRIRTRPPRETMLDDLLGDPFLQNFFGATVSKDINVASPPAEFTVLALPTEDRPPDFTGAVGTFKMSTDLSSKTTTAGDPLTLRMHVTGAGNFDRVESTMLDGVGQWKTYQPKATFTPADATGYRGEKVFEQPLIAAQPGDQTLPGLTFSFFNPNTRRYETARSSPLSVSVSAPAADAAARAAQTPAGVAGAQAHESNNGLRPDHIVAGGRVSSLVPPYFQPRFLAIPSALAVLFAGAWIGLHRRARANASQRARDRARSRAADEILKELQIASSSGDAARFFNSARTALQQSLAGRWQIAPEQVTAAEIDARSGEDIEGVRQIFAFADEVNYSGDALKIADFQRWMQIVRQQLTVEKAA